MQDADRLHKKINTKMFISKKNARHPETATDLVHTQFIYTFFNLKYLWCTFSFL